MEGFTTCRLLLPVFLGLAPAACGSTTHSSGSELAGGTGAMAAGGTAAMAAGGTTTSGGSGAAVAASGGASTGSGGGTTTSGGSGAAVAASGGASTGSGGSTDPASMPAVCTSPSGDPATGVITCAEGYSHRTKVVTCALLPRVGPATSQPGGEGCKLDSDCYDILYGYCNISMGHETGTCFAGCTTDQDCRTGSICICDAEPSSNGGSCHPSSCLTDDDCSGGSLCASPQPSPCISNNPFACRRPTGPPTFTGTPTDCGG